MKTGPYDLVVDTGGTPSIGKLRSALTPEGTLVLVAAAKGGLGCSGALRPAPSADAC